MISSFINTDSSTVVNTPGNNNQSINTNSSTTSIPSQKMSNSNITTKNILNDNSNKKIDNVNNSNSNIYGAVSYFENESDLDRVCTIFKRLLLVSQ